MPRRRLIFLDIDGVICCNCSAQLEPARLAELQRIVVQMKDELEKIKEQVLNVL